MSNNKAQTFQRYVFEWLFNISFLMTFVGSNECKNNKGKVQQVKLRFNNKSEEHCNKVMLLCKI